MVSYHGRFGVIDCYRIFVEKIVPLCPVGYKERA